MSSEWRSGKLGDFIELKRGYDLPQAKRKQGTIPLVSSSGVTDFHDIPMVRGPGVITGRYGTIGQVFYVEKDFWPLNTTLYVRDFKGNDPKFIHYFLKTLDFLAYSDKAAVPGVNRNHLHEAMAIVPSLAEQIAIAGFLGAIDDRITLLRNTNATLEAIAQALFKSWFVDFDPVRAKAEDRPPEGMDAATAALFPDSFEESEIGDIPKGWRRSTVGKSFTLTMGQSPPGDTYNDTGEGIPFYQGRTDFGFRFPSQRIFCTSPTRMAQKGDTLVSVRAPVGDVNLAFEACALGRGVASVRDPEGRSSFALYCMRSLRANFELYDGEGTVFGSINKKDFEAISVIDPNRLVVAAFDEATRPLDARIEVNEQLIRTLIQLRDILLPRLISGQLRLPEAESLLESAL